MKVVFVDNFDSFTFNLVDEFARRGCDVEVWRNTARAEHVLDRATSGAGPSLLVLSPGPGRPEAAGCCIELIRMAAGRVPVFGVCLGHQVMLEAFGVAVEQAETVLHGRSSSVRHEGDRLFDGIPSPFVVGRYHSLAVMTETVPDVLVPDAWTEDGEIMGMHHREHQTYGVQFHPESVLTPTGSILLKNFLAIAGEI